MLAMRRACLVSIGLVIFVAAATSQAQGTPPDKSPIQWSPARFNETVGEGQTRNVEVTLTSAVALKNVALTVDGGARSYVAISPATLPNLAAGAHQSVTLTLTAPLGTRPKMIEAIVLLDAKRDAATGTYRAMLPIRLNFCRCVVSDDVRLSYPRDPQWGILSKTLELGGPVTLNNFANAYLQGGVVPMGGAEITVTDVPLPSTALPTYIAKETIDAEILGTTAVTVAGAQATRVVSTDSYDGGMVLKNVNVYLPLNGKLHKLYLTYRNGDPSESAFQEAFAEVLSSLEIVP